jgi:hypothetical protein
MVAFSQEVFDAICERIADGESLRAICQDKGMPARVNVIRWLEKDEALRNQYARARELQADHEFDEIKAIADLADAENVQVARLRVDARKWRASKLRPKVYGDKLEVNGPGEGGAHVHKVEMTFVRPGAATPDR